MITVNITVNKGIRDEFASQIYDGLQPAPPEWEQYFDINGQPVADKYFWARVLPAARVPSEGQLISVPGSDDIFLVRQVWGIETWGPTEAPGAKILVSKFGASGK